MVSALSFAAHIVISNAGQGDDEQEGMGSYQPKASCSCCVEDSGRGCIDPEVEKERKIARRDHEDAKRPSQEERDEVYKQEQADIIEPSSPGCARFCDFVMNFCQKEQTAWHSLNNCLEKCADFSTTSSSLPYRDIIGDNSLQCREFWMDRIERSLVETGQIPDGMCDYVGTASEVSEFTARILKHEGFALGLIVNQTSRAAVTVQEVQPGSLIEEWNEDHPRELRVRKGDDVVAINGAKGVSEMFEKFDQNAIADFTFKRFVGGGMCDQKLSVDCYTYCEQMAVDITTGATGSCGNGTWQFLSKANCRKHCPKYGRAPDATDGNLNGNTLECRMNYLSIADTHSGGSLYRSYSKPKLQKEQCFNAGLRSKACKDNKTESRCQTYCHLNTLFCDSSETVETCNAYCEALIPEKLDCHLKYVSVAARCNNPEVPCFHRSVCNAAGSATAIGFESAPIPPAYHGPQRNPYMDAVKANKGMDPETHTGSFDPDFPAL